MQIKIIVSDFVDENGNKQIGYKSEPPYAELAMMFKDSAGGDESERAVILYALEAMGAIYNASQAADGKQPKHPELKIAAADAEPSDSAE